jgi:hypothetical protein
VDHRQAAEVGQATTQLVRVAGVVHQQVEAGVADRGEDGRLLRLEVELGVAARRGCHEGQAEPEVVQWRRRRRRTHAADHREAQERVGGQEVAAGAGQQLQRRPQHGPRRRGRGGRGLHLEHQRRRGRGQQGGQVEPPEQLPAQVEPDGLVRAGVAGRQGAQQAGVRIGQAAPRAAPLASEQHLDAVAVQPQPGHRHVVT